MASYGTNHVLPRERPLSADPRRNRRRMRAIAIAPLNGLVRNEPRVAAATDAVGGRAPARDVRGVLIGDTERETVELGCARRREVEHELVAVVQKPIAVDRLLGAYPKIQIAAAGS